MVDANPDQWPLRRGSLIYPLPIATACGRVLRARNPSERVNACLKAAEVLARYLAAVALTSFTSRSEKGEAKLSELQGNLSFTEIQVWRRLHILINQALEAKLWSMSPSEAEDWVTTICKRLRNLRMGHS